MPEKYQEEAHLVIDHARGSDHQGQGKQMADQRRRKTDTGTISAGNTVLVIRLD